ncbi:hypothetical protein QFC22_004735 [Naganishia vaughanmartiniae]|uniref:Uncharacterized protein n=1 Tax=Naganishia vaughanmartiniae TaxID=1424756 RepID=A0ACC2WYT7_9TREE|nr:hypothetical protein QFC22_004735 [Naganishia vaughanmartiniae]
MASLFGFGSTPVEIDIKLTNEEARRQVELKPSSSTSSTNAPGSNGGVVTIDNKGEKKELCPVYYDAESVGGVVSVRVKDGKKLVHEGIRLELVGAIVSPRAKREYCAAGYESEGLSSRSRRMAAERIAFGFVRGRRRAAERQQSRAQREYYHRAKREYSAAGYESGGLSRGRRRTAEHRCLHRARERERQCLSRPS